MRGGGTVKRSRGYSDNGNGSRTNDGESRTARRQVGWQGHISDDDFLDGKKEDNQQEIPRRILDGVFLPPGAMLLRAQENWRRTAANGYQQWQRRGIVR